MKCGGLGIRSAIHLAPSAFLASLAGSSELVHQIIRSDRVSRGSTESEVALLEWSKWHEYPPPTEPASFTQKSWDVPVASGIADSLLDKAPDDRARARLLASRCAESGAWLNVFPISACGLRMDNESTRAAVGLRLGAPLARPHRCCHCGAEMDELATHGLSCRWSEGRLPRHAAINDIICRSLSSAKVPARLEPNGLFTSDEKRPDGVSLLPWREGKCLIWDVTCPDSFAPSHLASSSRDAGLVAEQAERAKHSKYSALQSKFDFIPVAVEMTGVFGPEAGVFLRDLGKRLKYARSEPEALSYLLQRISVAVQHANCAAILGSLSKSNADLNCTLF